MLYEKGNLGISGGNVMTKEIAVILGGKISESDIEHAYRDEIEIFQQVNIYDAIKLAKNLENEGIKVIISTAGTASRIGKHVKIPVIPANHTYFDLLETLRRLEVELEVEREKVALIIHSSRNIETDRIQPFIKNHLSIYYYDDENDLQHLVSNLFENNYKVIVGGPTTLSFAERFGIICFQLYLRRETLVNVIDKAKSILEFSKKDREETQKLQTIINLFNDGILITDQKGIITACNPRALSILKMEENHTVGQKIYQITRDPTWADVYENGIKQIDIIRELRDNKFFVTRQPIIVNNKIIGTVGTFQEVSKIEKLEHQYRKLQTTGLTAKHYFKDIIGESETIKKTIEQAKAYSKADSTILIEGETGTGKEIFAQSIHNYSRRKAGPFVAINCAALPETLLESELFGYEEGAFTGAKRGGKAGLFELAHKGTIFLDEINQIPIQLQARILRAIQEKEVMRLGGERVIPVDVRIISAANKSLEEMVDKGNFRDDLYYRLNVLSLRLPPLRERIEDVPLLINYFLKVYTDEYGLTKQFSNSAITLLKNYNWPGNVRELVNFIERYSVISRHQSISDIKFVRDYVFKKRKVSKTNQQGLDELCVKVDTLEKMQEQLIKQILNKVSGNKSQAAMILGISRTTIWKKLYSQKDGPV